MSRTKEYIEAFIFAFGDGISMEELKRRSRSDEVVIRRAIAELNKSYSERKSAFLIVTEGNSYRMRLRDDLLHLAEDTLKTDMKKGVLMTLSLIASRGKIKQAELKNLRGNIAYKHVKELLARGLITVSKEGNTKIIRVSPSFFDYFDVKSSEFKDLKEKVAEDVKKESEKTVEYTAN